MTSTPFDAIRKSAFFGGLLTERSSAANQRSACGPAEPELPLAAVGQVEQAGEPPARQAPARLIERERDRCRQRRPHVPRRPACSVAVGDRRDARPERAARRARRSKPASAATIVAAAASRLSSRPARPGTATGCSPRRRSAASRCCWSISRASLPDEEVERGLVDLGRRMDVGAEDAHADPAEAAQRPEAVALPPGGLDAGAPVDLDAERARADLPRATGRPELDRNVAQPVGAPLEAPAGLVGVEPADGHACDPRTGGQLGRRTGEGEAEKRAHADEERRHEQRPLPDETAPRATPPRPWRTGGGTRAHVPRTVPIGFRARLTPASRSRGCRT